VKKILTWKILIFLLEIVFPAVFPIKSRLIDALHHVVFEQHHPQLTVAYDEQLRRARLARHGRSIGSDKFGAGTFAVVAFHARIVRFFILARTPKWPRRDRRSTTA
jgi:hypothetical protein